MPVGGYWDFRGLLHPLRSIESFAAIKAQNCKMAIEDCVLTIKWLPFAVILCHNISFSDPGRIPNTIGVISSFFKRLLVSIPPPPPLRAYSGGGKVGMCPPLSPQVKIPVKK